MIDESPIYAVHIGMSDDDCNFTYDVEHHFAAFPSTDLLVALKDEAEATFIALYDEDPEDKTVSVSYLDAVERAASSQIPPQPRL